ncbi:MAG TPA: hypothetical protein VFO13_08135, partial [Arthrobacter sp.]|nr:hypothetical protein [Arthrobacter sp.]
MDNDQVVTTNDNALGAGESVDAAAAATPPKRPVRTRRKALPKADAPEPAADAAVPAEATEAPAVETEAEPQAAV